MDQNLFQEVKNLRMNVYQVANSINGLAKHVEHLNWNLGKLVTFVMKDDKLLNKLVKEGP